MTAAAGARALERGVKTQTPTRIRKGERVLLPPGPVEVDRQVDRVGYLVAE